MLDSNLMLPRDLRLSLFILNQSWNFYENYEKTCENEQNITKPATILPSHSSIMTFESQTHLSIYFLLQHWPVRKLDLRCFLSRP